MTPEQIIEIMKEGNERFRRGERKNRNYLRKQKASAKGQYPAAVLLSSPRNHFLGMTFSRSGFLVAMSSPKNSTYLTLGGIELSFDLTNILWRIPS
jgi:hypothetical protein